MSRGGRAAWPAAHERSCGAWASWRTRPESGCATSPLFTFLALEIFQAIDADVAATATGYTATRAAVQALEHEEATLMRRLLRGELTINAYLEQWSTHIAQSPRRILLTSIKRAHLLLATTPPPAKACDR